MRLKLLAVLVAAMGIVALTGSPARAAETTLNTVKDGTILWVDTSVTDPTADSVTVKIYSPRDEDGVRRLWQKCHFDVTAAGEYHCGIDVSGSHHPTGRWVARAIVDRELVDTAWFQA